MATQLRAAALSGFAEVARTFGLDPDRALRRVGIDPAQIADPDRMIPASRFAALLEDAAQSSGCLQFGLLVSERLNLSSGGAVSLLLKHLGTAREVIEAAVRYQCLYGDGISLALEDHGEISIIKADFVTELPSHQAIEMVLGMCAISLTEVTAAHWRPESAHLTHGPPDDLSIHRRVFRCPAVFYSEFNGIVCSMEMMDAPNPGADREMARHARHYLDLLLADFSDGGLAMRVRRSIHLLLPMRRATLQQVAHDLGLHPRGLQRLLEREGRTFDELRNEARRALAFRYLADPRLPIESVAHLTGYSSPSSFTRWFSTEFGAPPATRRAELQS